MAIFKKIAASGKYQDDQAIPDLITYITSPAKTPSNFIDGIGISGDDIDALFGLCHVGSECGVIGSADDFLFADAGVFKAQRHIRPANSGNSDAGELVPEFGDFLKIRFPNPGDVGAVACAVVEADNKLDLLVEVGDKINNLLAAGGVFHQHHSCALCAYGQAFHASEAAGEAFKCFIGGVGLKTGRSQSGGGGCGVVNIVKSGEVDAHGAVFALGADADRGA